MTYQGLSPAELDEERARDHGGMVIVLDTDPGVRWALEKGLKRSGYDVRTASTSGEALRLLYAEPVRAVIMEILPEADLTPEVLTTVLESPSHPKVICVSMESEPKAIIECVRRGAADFVPKPFNLNDVRAVLRRALASQSEQRVLRRPGSSKADMDASFLIGVSHAIQELRTIIHQVAHTDLNCLIRGESGTGKDLVAREIHRLSARRAAFRQVNCTALRTAPQSELLGYEKAPSREPVVETGRFELITTASSSWTRSARCIPPSGQNPAGHRTQRAHKLAGRKHIHVDADHRRHQRRSRSENQGRLPPRPLPPHEVASAPPRAHRRHPRSCAISFRNTAVRRREAVDISATNPPASISSGPATCASSKARSNADHPRKQLLTTSSRRSSAISPRHGKQSPSEPTLPHPVQARAQ